MLPLRHILMLALLALLGTSSLRGQSVELYAGHTRMGVDLMWYRFFKDSKAENTRFLFFSRNRASTDYENRVGLFGSTNAVSYNLKSGLGLVVVGALTSQGLTPKAGVQFVKAKGDLLFFGWLVADVKREGNVDLFGMLRFTPALKGDWRLFCQAEAFPVYSPSAQYWNLTQRARLGLKRHGWGAGLMADLNQSGAGRLTSTTNLGGYLRHDF